MKRTTLIIAAATFALAGSSVGFAAEHGSMTMPMEHGGKMMHKSNIAHEEVVGGIKVTFKIMNMKEHMKGMELPEGMKDTDHLMIEFKDVKTGKTITNGQVKVKVVGPDKSEQVKNLAGMGSMGTMGGHFGADFDFSQKGKYGVMAKFKLADKKEKSVKFWYEVK
jgi:hypothetical protein